MYRYFTDLCPFADDSNLIFAIKNLLSLESIINSELSYVKNWLNTNELSLNIDKSNFCLIPSTQRRQRSPQSPVNYPNGNHYVTGRGIFDERPSTFKNIEIFPSRHELARIHFDFFGKECSRSTFASDHFVKGFSFVVAVGSLYHRKTIKDIFICVNANGRSCLKVKRVSSFQNSVAVGSST